MKKTLLFIAFAAFTFVASAQETPTVNTQTFKQAGGESNLQLWFAPFGSNPISLNDGGTIMYRKFNATGTSAFRIGFSVGSSKSTDVLVQAADTFPPDVYDITIDMGPYTLNTGTNPQADQTNKTFSFSIRPGYEMHCPGTDRLSPYWGAELVFTKSSTKSETDQISIGNYTAVYTDTTSVDPIVSAPYTINTISQKSGSTTFGINLIAGFDFYFAKNLSLGAELNFGYSRTSFSDLESDYVKNTTTTVDSGTFPATHTVTSSNAITSSPDQKQGSDSGFGPGVVAQIKLGWLF